MTKGIFQSSLDYGLPKHRRTLRLGDAYSGVRQTNEGPDLVFFVTDAGPAVHFTAKQARAIRKDLKRRIRAIEARTA